MNKKKIILIGAGGHCVSVIDVIEQEGKYEIFGILDNEKKTGDNILGYNILGNDDIIDEFSETEFYFLITVGQIKSAVIRKRIAERLVNKNLATIVSPYAYVSTHAQVQKGTIIMHNAFINAKANIGKHCIINTKSNIEHGVLIEDFCHISTGAMINGDCHIGEESFVGSNATLAQSIRLQSGSIISAGEFIKR